ncbi:hypothetical protein GCM10027517_32610 [Phycicoccus ginsengisoli]
MRSASGIPRLDTARGQRTRATYRVAREPGARPDRPPRTRGRHTAYARRMKVLVVVLLVVVAFLLLVRWRENGRGRR